VTPEPRLTTEATSARAVLVEQRRLQLRFGWRQAAWIAWAPFVGAGLSALGLHAASKLARAGEPLGRLKLGCLWFGLLYFGLAVLLLVTAPLRIRPRIVPCFRRELEPYGGPSSLAFKRGHALHREIDALDALAKSLGVTPLSRFGFSDDYHGQPVVWHAAGEAVRTLAALRQGFSASSTADVVADLEALASVLEIADARGVEFRLVLRLHRGDLQAASIHEPREGRFW
jgi:hypothetical protein